MNVILKYHQSKSYNPIFILFLLTISLYYTLYNTICRYDDITDLLGDSIHVSLSADNLSELDQDGILEL